MERNRSRKPGYPQGQGFDSSTLRHIQERDPARRRLRLLSEGAP